MLPPTLRRCAELGYRVFTAAYDLNVVGLRQVCRVQGGDLFDDVLEVWHTSDAGAWVCHRYRCSTDPTRQRLERPMNGRATAIVAFGQHRGLWRAGTHRAGTSTARPGLVQVAPVTVHRDSNRDGRLDLNSPTERGMYGINLHSGADSAGCQVVSTQAEVDEIIDLVRLQAAHGHGTTVSYTLLDGLTA